MSQTPSQQFTSLIESLNGKRLWETRCSAEGAKFVLECWQVPVPNQPGIAPRQVIIQRWRDGNCTIFRQSSLSNDLKTAMTHLRLWLTEPDTSLEFESWSGTESANKS